MNAFEEYLRLMLQRLDNDRGANDPSIDDAITDQMDGPYWDMTKEERELACQVSATLPRQ
jgi:hypothetical protein